MGCASGNRGIANRSPESRTLKAPERRGSGLDAVTAANLADEHRDHLRIELGSGVVLELDDRRVGSDGHPFPLVQRPRLVSQAVGVERDGIDSFQYQFTSFGANDFVVDGLYVDPRARW